MRFDLTPVYQDDKNLRIWLITNFRRVQELFQQLATQPARANTSGATLLQLETEVNELKARLRAFGVMET